MYNNVLKHFGVINNRILVNTALTKTQQNQVRTALEGTKLGDRFKQYAAISTEPQLLEMVNRKTGVTDVSTDRVTAINNKHLQVQPTRISEMKDKRGVAIPFTSNEFMVVMNKLYQKKEDLGTTTSIFVEIEESVNEKGLLTIPSKKALQVGMNKTERQRLAEVFTSKNRPDNLSINQYTKKQNEALRC